MRNPEITPDDIKIAIEQPDMYSSSCIQHRFYIKTIEGKGTIIVSVEKESENKYTVICADWLERL